jgi:hypothetical protein
MASRDVSDPAEAAMLGYQLHMLNGRTSLGGLQSGRSPDIGLHRFSEFLAECLSRAMEPTAQGVAHRADMRAGSETVTAGSCGPGDQKARSRLGRNGQKIILVATGALLTRLRMRTAAYGTHRLVTRSSKPLRHALA